MSMKVLVVEPDWRFGGFATEYLESRAHLVVQEPQPQQALRRARHWQPDLVIVAAEVAEKGFLTALTSLGRDGLRPAVLLTGWLDRYDVAWRAWQKGGDELLIKPVLNAEEFHQAVVAALENAAAGTRQSRRPARAASA